MNPAAEWTAAVLAFINACVALSVLVPLHRARAEAKKEQSILGSRVGMLMEIGLAVYAVSALGRGGWALAAALSDGVVDDTLLDWGLISISATLLIILVALRSDLRPIINSLRRSERALTAAIGAFQPEKLDLEGLTLSVREKEVLAVIAAGKVSDQEIADALFISTATAGTHVRNILKKAGLHDRRQLVLIGLREPPKP